MFLDTFENSFNINVPNQVFSNDYFENNFKFDFDTIPFSDSNIWIRGDAIHYDELTEEQRAEYQEELTNLRQQLEDQRAAMREKIAKMRNLTKEQKQQAQEQLLAQIEEVKEEQREALKTQRESLAQMREEQLAKARELRSNRNSWRDVYGEDGKHMARVYATSSNGWSADFERQMAQDGHVGEDGNFKLSMDDKKLKINGKKQSQAEWKKYVKLYESKTGQRLGKGFHIGIKNDGNGNRSTTVSISDESH